MVVSADTDDLHNFLLLLRNYLYYADSSNKRNLIMRRVNQLATP